MGCCDDDEPTMCCFQGSASWWFGGKLWCVCTDFCGVMCSVIGWLVVRLVTLYTRSLAALGVLLGIMATLFVLFLILFRIEYRMYFGEKKSREGELPALMLSKQ